MMGSRGMGAISPSKMPKAKTIERKDDPNKVEVFAEGGKVKSPAWQRKEGKNPNGGLNAKGRAAYNKANPGKPGLKAPQPEGGSRRDSFCARMSGMKKKLTGEKAKKDPNSRINKSLRAWNC
jgi:hypothetical protein